MTRIYYNNIFFDDANKTIEIYKDCPYEDVEDNEVEDLIEEMLDWGEWNAFVVPSKVTNRKIIYHGA